MIELTDTTHIDPMVGLMKGATIKYWKSPARTIGFAVYVPTANVWDMPRARFYHEDIVISSYLKFVMKETDGAYRYPTPGDMFVEKETRDKPMSNYEWLEGGLVIGYAYELQEFAEDDGADPETIPYHFMHLHCLVWMPSQQIETVRIGVDLLENSRFVSHEGVMT